ncbi:hypothetical protein DE146DRAFT_750308 [Phaeosphaeria sp. MPI-PUGE-AT-0046c]|nr:hypothetical protein DE146DRAFT_750308 [Phaeosphaeria sp. MPI-PUGE-AT-0046c]
MANRTPKFGRSVSMPVLQEQNEDTDPNSHGTIVPAEPSHTPTQSPGLDGSHQQLKGPWTRNRNGFSYPWAFANSLESADDGGLTQASPTPQNNWLPGLEHRSPAAETPTTPKDFPGSSGSFPHHLRDSSRTSCFPDVASPLTAKLYMRSMQANGSSLISSLPSPRHAQQPKKTAKNTSQKLDLHILKVSANAKGSPYHKPKGFGHSRKITDPFVDHVKPEDQSPLPSPFLTQAMRKMEHISSFQGGSAESAICSSPSSPANQRGYSNGAVNVPQTLQSPCQQDNICASSMSTFSPLPAMSPTAADFKPMMSSALRVDLPVPPPPLPSVDGQLVMTPVTRAYKDARAEARANWIREGAKTIAALGRLSFVAGQRFQQTGTREDYESWQRLVTAYEDATDLEKRQEGRRNMFMPTAMRAMHTGADNIADDQSAAFPVDSEDDEGHLLGFKMAYMERICAEVKRLNDGKREAEVEKEAEITTEMINTMSPNEKKELKKYLLARLNATAGKKT